MKKIKFVLILALAIGLFGALGITASAEVYTGTCGNDGNVTWSLDSNALSLVISGEGAMDDFSDSQKAPWLSCTVAYQKRLLSIEIQEGVTHIGDYAFQGQTCVERLSLPDGLISIGKYAFNACTSLTNIKFPDSLLTIGRSAFYDCTGLSSVALNDGIVTIGDGAFKCCALTSIMLPNTLEYLGSYAFFGCTMESVVIPDGITVIKEGTFPSLDLKHVTIPNSVVEIQKNAFRDKNKVDYFEVKYLGTQSQWNTISIANDYEEGNSVFDIATMLYYGCGGNLYWQLDSTSGTLNICGYGAMLDYGFGTAPWSKSAAAISSLQLSDGITKIGANAFRGCSKITSVTIPNAVASIGNYAFYNCSALENFIAQNDATTIGEGCFCGCSGLADTNGLIQYRKVLYGYSGSDTSITIPEDITHISAEALYSCSSLSGISFLGNAPTFGLNCIPNNATLYYLCDKSGWSDISYTKAAVHDLVHHNAKAATCTEIGWDAYDTCSRCDYTTYVEKSKLGHSYQAPTYVWTQTDNDWKCTATRVCKNDSSHIETEGQNATYSVVSKATCFTDGVGKYSVKFQNSAFQAQSKQVVIPKLEHHYLATITPASIGNRGFTTHTCEHCGDHYDDTYTDLVETGSCGNSLSWSIDYNAVLSIFGNGSMDDYTDFSQTPWYAYRSQITSLNLSEGIASIGKNAFRSLSKLSSVTVPSTVSYIGDNAFMACINLTNAFFNGNAPEVGVKVFAELDSFLQTFRISPPLNNRSWFAESTYNPSLHTWNGYRIIDSYDASMSTSLGTITTSTNLYDSNSIHLEFKPIDALYDKVVVLALYKNEKMVGIKLTQYDGESVQFDTSAPFDEAKIFAIESFANLAPMQSCVSVSPPWNHWY